MKKFVIILFIMISILFMSGCASDGFKRLGYDILSNYQCPTGDKCGSPEISRGQYQSQCLGGTALPDCDMIPPLHYDKYIEERDKALENLKGNK